MAATSDLAEVDFALFFWLRKAGMAIAARMPMMIMTTSSSMSVKPLSFSSADGGCERAWGCPPGRDVVSRAGGRSLTRLLRGGGRPR
jgi:hypothetical protein